MRRFITYFNCIPTKVTNRKICNVVKARHYSEILCESIMVHLSAVVVHLSKQTSNTIPCNTLKAVYGNLNLIAP